jgi:hypothetical protein
VSPTEQVQFFPASKPATGAELDISLPSIRNTRPCDADNRVFKCLLIVIGLIPSPGRIGGRKFDDKDPFRHRIAFQKIDLAATCDDAPTKARYRRQRPRQMSLIGIRRLCVYRRQCRWAWQPPG